MKRNITINLCGRLYSIDEDAYELMNHYIETLRNYFRKQEGGGEICNDIEARMAELFDELNAQGTEAITIEHVQDIIKRIGDLKDIIPEDEQVKDNMNGNKSQNANNGNTSAFGAYFESLRRKTFYRDTQDRKIAGVLSGCANYFGGSVTAWRIIYVVLVFFNFGLFSAVGALLFRSVFMGGSNFGLSLPVLSFNFLLVVLYIIVAVIAPEANRPEERLKMKGQPVNPERLAQEVTQMNQQRQVNKESLSAWNVIGGIIFIILSMVFGFSLIGLICFSLTSLTGAEVIFPHIGDGIGQAVYDAVHLYIWGGFAAIIVNIAIVVYCCIHGAMSSFRKIKSMAIWQRIVWLVLWILTMIIAIVLLVGAVGKGDRVRYDWGKNQQQEYREKHTHDGVFWERDADWNYFRSGGWTLVENENCVDHFTQTGQYYTGDSYERYLDAYNGDCGIVYTAERHDYVEPGIYRLRAAARTDGPNSAAIYAIVGCGIKEARDVEAVDVIMATIPSQGDTGGDIWSRAADKIGDDKVPVEMLGDSLRINDIANAHYGEGYGWNFVYTVQFVVEEATDVYYGITTEGDNLEHRCTYLSARDFELEKIQ